MPIAKGKGEWKDVAGDIWRPENKGDSVEGTLMNRRPGRYEWNNYTIDTGKGVKTVFGSAVLENRMTAIKDGQDVKIIFEGMQKNTRGQDMRMYRVMSR